MIHLKHYFERRSIDFTRQSKGSKPQNKLRDLGYKKAPTEQRKINSIFLVSVTQQKGDSNCFKFCSKDGKKSAELITHPGMSWLMPEDGLMSLLCSRNRSTWLNPNLSGAQTLLTNSRGQGRGLRHWLHGGGALLCRAYKESCSIPVQSYHIQGEMLSGLRADSQGKAKKDLLAFQLDLDT